MLVKNVNGEAVGASMVRDSEFYIELAKFVQAYTLIINNPNEFLAEIKENSIDEKKERISWEQLVKIIKKCDFGFSSIPTDTDLKVFYNYALEIGSLDAVNKRLATVSDVADAQKHYYNFVDKAKDKAESEYLKQHDVYLSRENEMRNADNALSKLKAGSIFAFIMMFVSCVIGCFGIVSFFVDNAVASGIGNVLPIGKKYIAGAVILLVLGLVLFYLFDRLHEYYKRKFFKLDRATKTIFERGNEVYIQETTLKRKLDRLTRELKTVQAQLNDKNKKYDVQENINRLKATNKYYKKFIENEESLETVSAPATDDERNMRAEDFAPVMLTREQEENLRRVGKEAIILEGQLDEEEYKEQIEGKASKEKEEENKEEKETETQDNVQERTAEQLKAQEKELLDSIDYIKEILGFSNEDESEKGK